MKTRLSITAAALAALTVLPMAGAHAAPQETVCAKGCDFSSIQAAIDHSSAATITIAPGTYVENLTVTRPVALEGSGDGTVLLPTVSNPNCDGNGGGSLCDNGSNLILVQASDVTIENLRLEGDNPNLTSGVEAGGADLDARNGIITDHTMHVPLDNLTVSHVKVSDIYLRGIYASSGGSFEFDHNTVDNVQADLGSIAMFNFGGSGVMADNKVTNANDALSANWSTGTQFLDNEVSNSASGVHTDNNGGDGGTADLIQGNTVRDCTTDGYGVWVFAPYVSPTVDSNTVKGCYIGLATYGSNISGAGATFSKNVVKEDGAKTTDPTGTYGAYLTTDMLGWGFGDLTATLTGNTFEHFDTGLFARDEPGAVATITVSPDNSFLHNGTGLDAETQSTVNAQGNWWGCKQGANGGGGCDTTTGSVNSSNPLTKKP